jgi:hypothetical protein
MEMIVILFISVWVIAMGLIFGAIICMGLFVTIRELLMGSAADRERDW